MIAAAPCHAVVIEPSSSTWHCDTILLWWNVPVNRDAQTVKLMKLLLAGDIHMGRASSRLPASLPADETRAARAWLRLVDVAVRRRVDVVCLSGDIADADNRFWEAIGPLEEGINRLSAAGIRTIAVAGNHDHDVLTRLARQMDREAFTLLGEGGQWERVTLEQNGQAAVHLDGWSFPRRRVRNSPVESYTLDADATIPVLGMVHGDLDDANSPYAPLDLVRLQGMAVDGWLLGHVHAPRLIEQTGRPWVLYPGSLQALDPGEPGTHGAWLINVERGGLSVPELLPLSSAFYNGCTVDLDGVDKPEDLETRLLEAIKREANAAAEAGGEALRTISLRLTLAGRTTLARQARQTAEAIVADLDLRIGQAMVGVDKLTIEALPPIDLAEHADSHTAPGALARLLLELDKPEPGETVTQLIRQTRQALAEVDGHRDFANLASPTVTDDDVKAHLAHEARSLLTELLSQTT